MSSTSLNSGISPSLGSLSALPFREVRFSASSVTGRSARHRAAVVTVYCLPLAPEASKVRLDPERPQRVVLRRPVLDEAASAPCPVQLPRRNPEASRPLDYPLARRLLGTTTLPHQTSLETCLESNKILRVRETRRDGFGDYSGVTRLVATHPQGLVTGPGCALPDR